ncbi:MAG: serine/arginine repetitive matrix protein 2 [Eubacteriaceae bacterium]|nr:serine/arginine repetitive matrix protein 2 [Eubacteriaceae bacterium]
MKMTRHNGRSGKNGTFNPKHNDRRFDIANSDHIDQDRAKQNVYWDCYQGFHFPADQEQEDKIVYSFEQVERTYYLEHYLDYCEGQHERNRQTGHSSRDRTPEDLLKDKKTCPEESLIQIGTMEQSVPPDVLAQIAMEFFEEFERRFGEHIHILDWSLHLDESTPHIHERHVFDCENRYGEVAPQQEKALEALGFDLPNPDQKPGKLNNRKMTFDAACRAMLFDICERHGLHLDHEPEYGGRKYLEKQDYILMKQKEKIAVQDQTISAKEAELQAITVRIEDTEAFVEEVSEVAYEKAVEVVTDKVVEETHNADFDIVMHHGKKVVGDPALSPEKKKFANQIFGNLLQTFSGMTQAISTKLKQIFREPERKDEAKEPIRRSIRELLARNKAEVDAANAARRAEQDQTRKKKQQNMDR